MSVRGRASLAPAPAFASAALLACEEGEFQAYARLDGRAPPAVGASGAVLVVFLATG